MIFTTTLERMSLHDHTHRPDVSFKAVTVLAVENFRCDVVWRSTDRPLSFTFVGKAESGQPTCLA